MNWSRFFFFFLTDRFRRRIAWCGCRDWWLMQLQSEFAGIEWASDAIPWRGWKKHRVSAPRIHKPEETSWSLVGSFIVERALLSPDPWYPAKRKPIAAVPKGEIVIRVRGFPVLDLKYIAGPYRSAITVLLEEEKKKEDWRSGITRGGSAFDRGSGGSGRSAGSDWFAPRPYYKRLQSALVNVSSNLHKRRISAILFYLIESQLIKSQFAPLHCKFIDRLSIAHCSSHDNRDPCIRDAVFHSSSSRVPSPTVSVSDKSAFERDEESASRGPTRNRDLRWSWPKRRSRRSSREPSSEKKKTKGKSKSSTCHPHSPFSQNRSGREPFFRRTTFRYARKVKSSRGTKKII